MRMNPWPAVLLPVVLTVAACDKAEPNAATNQMATLTAPTVDVPYETFTLDNGLTVVVHEDHKTPIVAINVWYHVGSKNEPEGRSGFAHLFEHLMFQGTENFKGEFFEPFERVGATDQNGTTNEDRTNYFENVPSPALDMALWMESDRMGHFIGSVTQELLDEQRGVVKNEKRQGLNQPYGEAWQIIGSYTYPKGHPYSHSVIGSMEDINAASLDDVKQWFDTWYGPSNAVIALAGDVTMDEAKEKVELYFGDIPPGPPVERPAEWVAKMEGPTRLAIEDEVPQARLYKVWNVPPYLAADERRLELVSNLLTSGKTSRLYERLVYQDELTTDAVSFVASAEIGSQFFIYATARKGIDLADVEAAIDEELARLTTEGPTEDELQRAKMAYFSSGVYSSERIGGFGGKSDLLASSQIYGGSPDAWVTGDAIIRNATSADLKATMTEWLDDGVFSLEVLPPETYDGTSPYASTPKRSDTVENGMEGPQLVKEARDREFAANREGADRTKLPDTGTPPDLTLPPLQRATLGNGLQIVLAERHEAPVVRAQMVLTGGGGADPKGLSGLANLTMRMLDEGTETRDALAISRELQRLGASVSSSANLDHCFVSLSTLATTLEPSLELYSEIALRPSFADAELDRQRTAVLARIDQEKASPTSSAFRLLGPLMFGDDHAYGVPLTGSGTIEGVQAITRDDLVQYHQTWFRPDQATLVVVGDTTLATLMPKLEKTFGSWTAPSEAAPERNVGVVKPASEAKIYTIAKPNSEQTMLVGGLLLPPRKEIDVPLELVNGVLGGQFSARLNMNLREDKHWAYGAYSFIVSTANQRVLGLFAPVQTDKTAEGLFEMQKELVQIAGKRPPTADEVNVLKDNLTLALPGENETGAELLSSLVEIVVNDLPDDYWNSYVSEVRGTTLEEVSKAATDLVRADQTTWIAVGDLERIAKPVAKLGIAEIQAPPKP
ncbi:MAG: pitrilysin family protein [Myxococcota bacterium]